MATRQSNSSLLNQYIYHVILKNDQKSVISARRSRWRNGSALDFYFSLKKDWKDQNPKAAGSSPARDAFCCSFWYLDVVVVVLLSGVVEVRCDIGRNFWWGTVFGLRRKPMETNNVKDSQFVLRAFGNM